MKIGFDMMGGDFAPQETITAVNAFIQLHPDCELVLYGNTALFASHFSSYSSIECIHSTQVVEMHEHPTKALKEKPQSSIVMAFHDLVQHKLDAFVSAGNTGAMLVGAAHIVKPIEGVLRPSIPALFPRQDNTLGILLDVGLNADCKPEYLEQFAVLGSLYAKHILNIENPKVALLNIGEEEGKGNLLAQATFPLLKNNTQIQFIGNVEGRDILKTTADVIVCDGFTGNILLKMAESIYDIFKIDRHIKDEYLERFNYDIYGGTPVLGVNKPIIVGHGVAKKEAFIEMLMVARKMVIQQIPQKIKESFIQA